MIVTGQNIDNCIHECDDNGKGIMTFYNYDKTMTIEEFNSLSEEEQRKYNVHSGSVTCSICESAYINRTNSFYLVD